MSAATSKKDKEREKERERERSGKRQMGFWCAKMLLQDVKTDDDDLRIR
jgi:hypothetical protein